ncbi:MAG: ABC transporter permease subunit [Spirochaetaceae bacterium]|nr:ABC transporter permease subunit [Spirochaetaceae bacterium]
MKRNIALLKPLTYFLSAILLLLIWYVAAKIVSSPLILPTPMETLVALKQSVVSIFFWQHILITSLRSILAFCISVLLGTVLGLLCGVSSFFRHLLEFPVAIIRATPVVSFVLLAIFWLGSSALPVFVAVLMTLPVMISSVQSGIENTNYNLLSAAKIYGFSKLQAIKYVYIPSCVPSFLGGALATFGQSWKVIAAGEVLSLPRYGAGTLLQSAKVHLETSQVFAITAVLVVICFVLELVFNQGVKHLLKSGKYS